jgi:hypothetical protein
MALVIIDRYQTWIGRTLTLHNPSFATISCRKEYIAKTIPLDVP